MLKFTNSKVLTLSAMLVLGTMTAFGQVTDSKWTGTNTPAPEDVKFPILYSTVDNVPALPGGAVAEGVYYHAINEAGVAYVPGMATEMPTGNETQTYFWKDGSKLGIFLGDKQKGEVLINLSTKYLKDFKDLSLKLSRESLGKTAYSTAKWSIEVSVYDLEGNLLTTGDLYKDGGSDEAKLTVENIFSTKDDEEKTINLFSTVEDPITDLKDLKDGALSNKFIQIKLYSDAVAIVETPGGSMSHFAPALIISDFKANFALPDMELAVDKALLEAGKGRLSCETGTLTLTAENFAYPANAKVSDVFEYTPALSFNNAPELHAAEFATQPLFDGENQVEAVKATYLFKPLIISENRAGSFAVKLKEDGPIRLAPATAQVIGNSKPELTIDKNHISFYKNEGQTQVINVTSGKNIPAGETLIFKAIPKRTTDQTEEYGVITIDNTKLIISSCGVATGSFTATLDQNMNDITRPEAWTIAVAEPKESVVYPTAIAVAGVGALWLTYEGQNFDGTSAKYEADNVFFSAYDAEDDLAGDRKQSRVKTYMLHGSELKATEADGFAIIKIKMNKEGQEQNDTDNQEFRFRVDETKPWTNSNTGILEIRVNTLSDKEMKELREEGKPIYVQFVPNKDGFVVPGTVESDIKWTPDTYELTAGTNVAGYDVTAAAAGLFGDTRANLWSNMNTLHNVDIMHNSTAGPFGNLELLYPEFQKYYGKDYLEGCPYDNVLSVSTFYVAGYNLEQAVTIDKKVSAGAFTYSILDKLTGEPVTDKAIEPNKYGEVLAEVTVTFAPTAKPAVGHKAEDLFTVTSGEKVITKGGQLAPDGSDVTLVDGHPEISSLFDYKAYLNEAEVYGFIYKPTLTIDMPESMTAYAGEAAKTAQIKISGTEFNPLTEGESTILLTTVEGTSFNLTNVTNSKIDINGNFTATANLVFTPNSMCEGLDNSVIASVGCKTIEQAVEGMVYWNSKTPELINMNYGDIDGHTATLKWKPVAGAEYYIVKVGHMKPKHISENVFISELRASEADNTLAVELFNGTASVINPQMLVNYYLKITVTDKAGEEDIFYGHFTNTDINAIATAGGWENKALIVKEYHSDNDYAKVIDGTAESVNIAIGDGLTYKVQLMEGANQIDVFSFGEAGAHLGRLANVANLKMNKGNFNIADWETSNTSLISINERAYFIWQEESNFELSVEDGAESMGIVPEGNTKDGYITTKVYNLTSNSLYDVMVTAYNTCLTNEDGELMSSTNGYSKDFIKTSVSGQTPTGDVTFDYNGAVTGNGDINANAIKVVAGEGVVTIYNAAGKKVVVNNILGQAIANTVLTSDNATISAPAGLVVVTVEGEKAVKAIIK